MKHWKLLALIGLVGFTGFTGCEHMLENAEGGSKIDWATSYEDSADEKSFYLSASPGWEFPRWSINSVDSTGFEIFLNSPLLSLYRYYKELGYEPYGAYRHNFKIKEMPLFWDQDLAYFFKDIESTRLPREDLASDSPYLDNSYQRKTPALARVTFESEPANVELKCPWVSNQNGFYPTGIQNLQLGVYDAGKFVALCEYKSGKNLDISNPVKEYYRYLPVVAKILENGKWLEVL